MKTKKFLNAAGRPGRSSRWSLLLLYGVIASTLFVKPESENADFQSAAMLVADPHSLCYHPKGCVFQTLFGEESSEYGSSFMTPENVEVAIDRGLRWLTTAQHPDGGWGAGSHSHQHIMDPHRVKPDPATTAMVGMALLRTGTRPGAGPSSRRLDKAIEFLLSEVENTPINRMTITSETGTQIQSKLGVNIDAVLVLQFFTNLMEQLSKNSTLYARVSSAANVCVSKIQQLQQSDGSISGAGWAGVLQSALASNALEAAEYNDLDVDSHALERSRNYQKQNFDPESGAVDATMGAGVVLYSVSGSVRASAKQARKVREEVERAKRDGRMSQSAPITPQALEEIGFEEEEALLYSTSYQVYESSKTTAQSDKVLTGFGNNGGEEFLSYLQTGESLIINKDEDWHKWYEKTSGRLISIQNQDGSWNGHHCITSPVFCTATVILTLSIDRDVDQLIKLGGD